MSSVGLDPSLECDRSCLVPWLRAALGHPWGVASGVPLQLAPGVLHHAYLVQGGVEFLEVQVRGVFVSEVLDVLLGHVGPQAGWVPSHVHGEGGDEPVLCHLLVVRGGRVVASRAEVSESVGVVGPGVAGHLLGRPLYYTIL
jgi:hypothetical protein